MIKSDDFRNENLSLLFCILYSIPFVFITLSINKSFIHIHTYIHIRNTRCHSCCLFFFISQSYDVDESLYIRELTLQNLAAFIRHSSFHFNISTYIFFFLSSFSFKCLSTYVDDQCFAFFLRVVCVLLGFEFVFETTTTTVFSSFLACQYTRNSFFFFRLVFLSSSSSSSCAIRFDIEFCWRIRTKGIYFDLHENS